MLVVSHLPTPDKAVSHAENEAYSRQAGMVCIVDMGMHLLPKFPGRQLLVQLLPPGLEERARIFKSLVNSSHKTPGMLHCDSDIVSQSDKCMQHL